MKKFILAILIILVCFCTLPVNAQYGGGSGTPEDPYQISSAADWQMLTSTSSDWDKHFIFTADLDLEGVPITPVGCDITNPFAGVFDGNGFAIRNATINQPGSDRIGIFGYVGGSGRIQNLGAENVNITGRYNVGGLVGYLYGGSITNCHSTGSMNGNGAVGGLVGGNRNSSITNCHSTGPVSGTSYVGGWWGRIAKAR